MLGCGVGVGLVLGCEVGWKMLGKWAARMAGRTADCQAMKRAGKKAEESVARRGACLVGWLAVWWAARKAGKGRLATGLRRRFAAMVAVGWLAARIYLHTGGSWLSRRLSTGLRSWLHGRLSGSGRLAGGFEEGRLRGCRHGLLCRRFASRLSTGLSTPWAENGLRTGL